MRFAEVLSVLEKIINLTCRQSGRDIPKLVRYLMYQLRETCTDFVHHNYRPVGSGACSAFHLNVTKKSV
jgi:hypothetical protein